VQSVIIKVKLFGMLNQNVPGYQSNQGLKVRLPEKSKVADLLANLGISESQKPVVIKRGRILSKDDILEDGIEVDIMQAIRGG
jgi:sulfur carrier protein ThiS